MAGRVSRRVLSELIGSIYDCTLQPDLWEETLAGIVDALDSRTAVLSLSDRRNGQLLIAKTVGIEPYWLERMAEHGAEVHARLNEALASWPSLDEPYIVSRELPPEYLETSPYYQLCFKGQGLIDVIQYFLILTADRFAGFAVARHGEQGLISEHQIELGGLLLPHIRRAVTISNVLDVRAVKQARLAETLDALSCGVVLADAAGAIVHANRSAEDMLVSGTPIRNVGGKLAANAPAATRELAAAIVLAAGDESEIGKTGLAVRLTGPDDRPSFAHVLPMNGSELRTRIRPDAVAAVFIGRHVEDEGEASAMAAAFGLTPAESQVLASLLAGRTRAETAAYLGISLATAKTHLLRIFEKTGVRRQAELIGLASRMPPTKKSN